MIKLSITVFISLFLIGCASKSSLKSSTTMEEVCSTQNIENTYDFLVKKMRMHYLGSTNKSENTEYATAYAGSSALPMNSTAFIDNKKINNNKYTIIYSIKNGITHRMYGEFIQLERGSGSCNTHITLRYMNSRWKSIHGSLVKKWLNEQSKYY